MTGSVVLDVMLVLNTVGALISLGMILTARSWPMCRYKFSWAAAVALLPMAWVAFLMGRPDVSRDGEYLRADCTTAIATPDVISERV